MCESGERWVEGHLGDAALTVSYAPPTWSTTVCVITSRPTHSDEQRGACALDDALAPERAVCTLPPESRIQCGFGPVGGTVELPPEGGVGCSCARPEARETAAASAIASAMRGRGQASLGWEGASEPVLTPRRAACPNDARGSPVAAARKKEGRQTPMAEEEVMAAVEAEGLTLPLDMSRTRP